MAKKNKLNFTVMYDIKIEVDCPIVAESLEEALKGARDMKEASEILENNNVTYNDWNIKVTGVFE